MFILYIIKKVIVATVSSLNLKQKVPRKAQRLLIRVKKVKIMKKLYNEANLFFNIKKII